MSTTESESLDPAAVEAYAAAVDAKAAAAVEAAGGTPEPEPDPETYVAAVDLYLAAATWLTAADAPFKIHARKLAASLDRQLDTKGEIQSALASTFAKVMGDLDKRRPGPPPAPAPDPLKDGVGPHGEASIFGLPLDG